MRRQKQRAALNAAAIVRWQIKESSFTLGVGGLASGPLPVADLVLLESFAAERPELAITVPASLLCT